MGEEQNKSAFENEEQVVSKDTDMNETIPETSVENNEDETQFVSEPQNDFSDDVTDKLNTENDSSEETDSAETFNEYSFENSEESSENTEEGTENQVDTDLSNYQGQSVNVEAQESTPVKTKKKGILYPSTIVVLVLVVASIVIYAVYASFQPSIKGAWVSTSVDEASTANSYLVLGDDNVAYMTLGTMRYMGVYSTSFDEDGQKILTVDIPYALQSNFVYELQGDIMTLVMEGDTTEYTFKNVELPDYTLTVPDDYVRDDNLLGKWKDYTYDIEYTFRADGTMLINEAGVVEADCIYNIVDGTIHVEYLAREVYSMDMEYTVDGNNLTIGVMNFQKIADENGNVIQTEEQATEADTTAETTVEETVAA